MPIQLHSLFEITEQLPKDEVFRVRWGDYAMNVKHNEVASIEKHYNKNLYIYDVINTPSNMKVFQCVALPYNYEKGIK